MGQNQTSKSPISRARSRNRKLWPYRLILAHQNLGLDGLVGTLVAGRISNRIPKNSHFSDSNHFLSDSYFLPFLSAVVSSY